jgi:hypothetical protein
MKNIIKKLFSSNDKTLSYDNIISKIELEKYISSLLLDSNKKRYKKN